jgi:hypothetical protein
MKNSSSWVDRNNFKSTYGILFFGVPNRGMNNSSLIAMVEGQSNLPLVLSLETGHPDLRDLHNRFCEAFSFRDSIIISFFETETSATVEKVCHFEGNDLLRYYTQFLH